MLKFIRSATTQRVAFGFVLGAAAMLLMQPDSRITAPVAGAVPALAPLGR